MILSFHFPVWETFLPYPDSPEKLLRPLDSTLSVEIAEADISEFRQAYLIQEIRSQFQGYRWQEASPAFYTEEIRMFRGRFYRPFRIRFGAAVSRMLPSPEQLISELEHLYAMRHEDFENSDCRFNSRSVVLDSTTQEAEDYFRRRCAGYLYSRGELWEACSEPGYLVETFRIGVMKYTGMRISRHHGSGPAEDLFSAWEKNEALRYYREQIIAAGSIPRECDVCRIIPVEARRPDKRSAAFPPARRRNAALKAI